jgi:hypothetical protein
MTTPSECIQLVAQETEIKRAQEIREARDARFENIYAEESSDLRWVGDLGEIVFDRWLTAEGVPHEWFTENPAGQPDFKVGTIFVGLKTVKRKGGVRAEYSAQITDHHAREPVDHFFFISYDTTTKTLWLLGGISKADFLAKAKHYGPGEKVHENYTVRPGHAIDNIDIAHLTPPKAWLRLVGAPKPPTNDRA